MLVLLGASIAACGDSSTPHDTSADDTLADTSDLTDETAPDTSDSSAETSDAQDDTTEVEAFTCTNTSDCQGYFGPLGACQLASCNTSTGRCIRSNKFDGTPCNDFDSCTTDDGCRSGACIGATAVNCDDGRACTTDSCDRRLGCQNVVREGACDDGNRCTANDQCAPNAKCLGSPVVCDDDNVCTADRCEPATGCVYTPLDPCPAEAR
jgi:hypothetical protein